MALSSSLLLTSSSRCLRRCPCPCLSLVSASWSSRSGDLCNLLLLPHESRSSPSSLALLLFLFLSPFPASLLRVLESVMARNLNLASTSSLFFSAALWLSVSRRMLCRKRVFGLGALFVGLDRPSAGSIDHAWAVFTVWVGELRGPLRSSS